MKMNVLFFGNFYMVMVFFFFSVNITLCDAQRGSSTRRQPVSRLEIQHCDTSTLYQSADTSTAPARQVWRPGHKSASPARDE